MDNATFVKNRSGDAGLAVMSLGIVEDMSNITFESNTYYCRSGTYGYEIHEDIEVTMCCKTRFARWWYHVSFVDC